MSKEASVEKVWFSRRGEVHMPLGGEDRTLRFRTHEISQLEGRMGKGILTLLSEENLGLSFLRNAIIVGVAHQFIGKKGKSKKTLTEDLVGKWMDGCDGEEGRLNFEELTESIIKAVVGGLPGGDKYIDAMDDDVDDDAEDGNGDPRPPEQAGTSARPPVRTDKDAQNDVMAHVTRSTGGS